MIVIYNNKTWQVVHILNDVDCSVTTRSLIDNERQWKTMYSGIFFGAQGSLLGSQQPLYTSYQQQGLLQGQQQNVAQLGNQYPINQVIGTIGYDMYGSGGLQGPIRSDLSSSVLPTWYKPWTWGSK